MITEPVVTNPKIKSGTGERDRGAIEVVGPSVVLAAQATGVRVTV